jgi:hypothetical protein
MASEAEQAIEEILESLKENEAVTLNDDGTRTVKLSTTIKVKEGRDLVDCDELTFRAPTARDLLVMDQEKGGLAKSYRLACQLCGLSYGNFLSLNGEDALLCISVAQVMGKKSQTGGIS